MASVFLTTAYLAPVEYYIQLNTFPKVIIEKCDNYIKQTYRNRCTVASANGLQILSIPIEKPRSLKCFTRDIRIAEHGNWQHLHWNAIISAYNSTPFFEYYTDDFLPFYKKKYKYLFDLNEELRNLICLLLDISPAIEYSKEYRANLAVDELDLREKIHPKKESYLKSFKPYYQVFENRFGFQPDLSIIDLLFNMGPEAVLYLK